MKIKAVCEKTGLTDRTVRFYIEEGLLSPKYKENYLGRKTFDFSDEDVKILQSISVFRKFGLTVAEIKELYRSPEKIVPLAQEMKRRLQENIESEKKMIEILSLINTDRSYTPREFAIFLSLPVESAPLSEKAILPKEKFHSLLRRFGVWLEVRFPIYFPLLSAVAYTLFRLQQFSFPKIKLLPLLFLLLFLAPSVTRLCFEKLDLSYRIRRLVEAIPLKLFGIFAILCIIPVTFLFCSQTTNTEHYRAVDLFFSARNSVIFNDLFPAKVSGQNAEYYYAGSEIQGYAHEICAEWTLHQEEFEQEVARVRKLFECRTDFTQEEYRYDAEYAFVDCLEMQLGNYTCLALCSIDLAQPEKRTPLNPFEPSATNYYTFIFAYDEQSSTVRYIFCHPRGAKDTPHYLSVEW